MTQSMVKVETIHFLARQGNDIIAGGTGADTIDDGGTGNGD
ncbi:MAG: hypothetical protein R3D88_06545 [Alphaproteobacteria bacterium]